MYSLYIHINKSNGKRYVGITNQVPVSRRWHNGEGYSKCPLFYKAICKYGWNGFTHNVIYDNCLTKENAETLEKEYIRKYKSNNREYGYNIQSGGGIKKLSDIQRLHLKEINIGKKHSEETKKKMSLSHIGKQKCLGYKHTEETKQKHKLLWLGNNNCRAKAVDQYDLEGNFIKHYDYMNQIKEDLDIKSTTHISQCCNGLRHKCHGFIWKYSE